MVTRRRQPAGSSVMVGKTWMSWRVTCPGTTGCADAWVKGWTGRSTAPEDVVQVLVASSARMRPQQRARRHGHAVARGRDGLDGGRQLGVGCGRRHVHGRVDRAGQHLRRGERRRGVDQRSRPGPQRHVVEVAGIVRVAADWNPSASAPAPHWSVWMSHGLVAPVQSTVSDPVPDVGADRRQRAVVLRERIAPAAARHRSSTRSAWRRAAATAPRRPSFPCPPELLDVEVQRRRRRGQRRLLAQQPGVEPLELERRDVDARPGRHVLPRAHEQLVARRDRLVRASWPRTAAARRRGSAGRRSSAARPTRRGRSNRRPGRPGCGRRQRPTGPAPGCAPPSSCRRTPAAPWPVSTARTSFRNVDQHRAVRGHVGRQARQPDAPGAACCRSPRPRPAAASAGLVRLSPDNKRDVGGVELRVGDAALCHGVGVEVVARDDREHRLDR